MFMPDVYNIVYTHFRESIEKYIVTDFKNSVLGSMDEVYASIGETSDDTATGSSNESMTEFINKLTRLEIAVRDVSAKQTVDMAKCGDMFRKLGSHVAAPPSRVSVPISISTVATFDAFTDTNMPSRHINIVIDDAADEKCTDIERLKKEFGEDISAKNEATHTRTLSMSIEPRESVDSSESNHDMMLCDMCDNEFDPTCEIVVELSRDTPTDTEKIICNKCFDDNRAKLKEDGWTGDMFIDEEEEDEEG